MEITEGIKGIPNALVSLPNLQFLAITTGRLDMTIEDIDVQSKESWTWWRICNQEGDQGKHRVAEPFPGWIGEQLRERLESMDYKSLSELKSCSTILG